jgi:outer membrane lipoprotein SlyB
MTQRLKHNNKAERRQKKKEEAMADKDIEIKPKTYVFAIVGAVIAGGMGGAALGGDVATISSAVVGALAGGALGMYF